MKRKAKVDPYEKARDTAEEAVFDWYAVDQGWYDSLPEDAIEALHEQVAQAIVRGWRPKEESE